MSEIRTIFNKYGFSIFGCLAVNPFYNDAMFIAHQISNILRKNNLVSSDSIDGLTGEFFLDGYRLTSFYGNLDKDIVKAHSPADHPYNSHGYIVDNLRERISSKY